MPATVGDWNIYPSETWSTNPATNGGRRAQTELASGALANVFPVGLPELVAVGYTEWRKIFAKLENTDSNAAAGCYGFCLDTPASDDEVSICASTAYGDFEADVDGTAESDFYGMGVLSTTITAGVTSSCSITIKNATRLGFTLDSGSLKCFISDGVSEEYFDIDTITGQGTLTLTLTKTTGTFAYSYSAGASVSACMPARNAGLVVATAQSFVVTSAAGTFDDTDFEVNNEGTREDTYTVTVSAGGVTFAVEGLAFGSLASGAMASDYTAIDENSKVLFVIPASCWGGTWAQNDTLVFDTTEASIEMWARHVVPAGCTIEDNDYTRVRVRFAPV